MNTELKKVAADQHEFAQTWTHSVFTPFNPGNADDNKSTQSAVQISAILIAAQHHDLIKITSMN